MRKRLRYAVRVRAVKCLLLQSPTGALHEVEDAAQQMDFMAFVCPIDQRAWRDAATLRPRERVLVCPGAFPNVRQGDRLYVGGDARALRVTEARRYPKHMEIEAEVMP